MSQFAICMSRKRQQGKKDLHPLTIKSQSLKIHIMAQFMNICQKKNIDSTQQIHFSFSDIRKEAGSATNKVLQSPNKFTLKDSLNKIFLNLPLFGNKFHQDIG